MMMSVGSSTRSAQRLQILVRTGDPVPLVARLREVVSRIPARVGRELGTPVLPGEYDVALGLTTADGDLESTIEDLTPLRAALASQDAVLIAGAVHEIIPGADGPLRVTFPVARRETFTREAFSDYWLNVHTAVPRSIPGFHSYSQLHTDERLSEVFAVMLGVQVGAYDGCALVGHTDMAEFEMIMSHPIFVERSVPDMASFVDADRSSFNLFELSEQ